MRPAAASLPEGIIGSMDFLRRAPGAPSRLALFPGAFNPPTIAHLGLAQAALACAAEVLFVLPRAFPHKTYREGPSFEQRLPLLLAATAAEPRFSIASAPAGLFIDIARASFLGEVVDG
ncbi:MAG TPA: hypothetical protein DEH78_31800, partial [Solibacterales bacterium]|nr:hypothetical protein [Bryobacterales bacterium]